METATTNCSVALTRDGEILALREENRKSYSHAEKLHVFIEEVLKQANMQLKDLDAVAISKGPGSYTGLRIGVSAAKGLCYALDIPLISVATLQVLALQGANGKSTVIPLLDARRMEVYSAVFNVEREEIRTTQAEILEPNSFKSFLENGSVTFLGDGAQKFEAICHHPNALFIKNTYPSAKEMVEIATAKYKIGDTEDVAYFEPYYLKDFVLG